MLPFFLSRVRNLLLKNTLILLGGCCIVFSLSKRQAGP